jgi:uncharacterized membrane protein
VALRFVITVLCGVGLYASLFMLRKTRLAGQGALTEPSVVQTPRARLFGRVPNALIGALYYPTLGLAVWGATRPWEALLLAGIACAAAAVSVVLAYSLLFVTKMPCPYCWSAHVINWLLALCTVAFLFTLIRHALR